MAEKINVKVAKFITKTTNRKQYLKEAHKPHIRCGIYHCVNKERNIISTPMFNLGALANTEAIQSFMKRRQNV